MTDQTEGTSTPGFKLSLAQAIMKANPGQLTQDQATALVDLVVASLMKELPPVYGTVLTDVLNDKIPEIFLQLPPLPPSVKEAGTSLWAKIKGLFGIK